MKLASLLAAVLCLALPLAQAQGSNWPSGTVKIVVPYPPGAEPDVLARDIAALLATKTGNAFVVENRPGANAIIGTDTVAKSAGDGATLLMVDRLSVVTNPVLYSKLPFNPEKDLKPVTDVGTVQLFLALSESFPGKTYRDFVAQAKAKPGEMLVGIAGLGHVNHIAMAMLERSEGYQVNFVPYKGLAPAVQGFLGGEVHALLTGGLVAQQMASTKPIKLVAVGNDTRLNYLPNVPTIAEAGGKAGTIPSTVFSLFLPGSASDALAQQVSATVASVVDAEFIKRYAPRGIEVRLSTPAQTAAQLQSDRERYGKLLKSLGMKIE